MSDKSDKNDKKMNGATSLVRSLEHAGVDVMFGIPGGAILPAYDPLFDSSIRHILVRHEQAAVHAADGYARATGKVGVALVTSGPGVIISLKVLLNVRFFSFLRNKNFSRG